MFLACNNKEQSTIVHANELLPQSKRNYSYPKDTTITTAKLDTFQMKLQQFYPAIQFSDTNVLYDINSHFLPNQLGYTTKENYFFELDSVPYHFLRWTYTDSLHTINAFYNWLDCFGNHCKSIRIDENKNGTKNGFLLYVSNKKIAYLESTQTIAKSQWDSTLFSLPEPAKWNYVIKQSPIGKLQWVKSVSDSSSTN